MLFRSAFKLAEKLGRFFSIEALTEPYKPVVDKIEDEHIMKMRVSLKKDTKLIENKARLTQVVSDFESKCKYSGHITINVDPV